MKLDRLQTFFSTSPSARLLRSPNAPHIVCFLHRQFKQSGAITWLHSELAQRLAEFQESIHATEPNVLCERAEAYLTGWSTGDSRWLRRFLDAAQPEPVYELTPHTEDVLKFLSDVLDRSLGFVGTESRLKRIIETLSDIVVRGSDDPARRLDYLQAERERIDREIAVIQSGGMVATYSPTAIRERFADVISDLTSLLGDFRAVEDSFKEITRDVQKRQAETSGTRGDILGFALDAEDSLKSQDQGVSFDEFVRLVLSPVKQDELETIVNQLHGIEALAGQCEGLARVKGMIGNLSGEAEKVLRTTRRLSSTLRRLLDSRATAGRLRLAEVLRDIRASAVRLADSPPGDVCGVHVFTELELSCASERVFWTAPTRFQTPELTDHKPSERDRLTVFRQLAQLQRLDWSRMRQNIGASLQARSTITLAELLEAYPPDSGPVEVLGYLQIAHDDGHVVDSDQIDRITIARSRHDRVTTVGGNGSAMQVTYYDVPRVTFVARPLRNGDNGMMKRKRHSDGVD